jgi:hypothetical protein
MWIKGVPFDCFIHSERREFRRSYIAFGYFQPIRRLFNEAYQIIHSDVTLAEHMDHA